MLSRIGKIVLAAAVIAALASCKSARTPSSSAGASGGGIAWETAFSTASRQASSEKKPMMIDFYADWCHWCKELDKNVYTDPQVIEKAREFVPLKLDTEQDKETPTRYGITGLPTIVFLSPEGKEIGRVVGYEPANEFLAEMEKALAAAR